MKDVNVGKQFYLSFLFLKFDTVFQNLPPEKSPTFDKLNKFEQEQRSLK